jgi:hypothetical protein
MTSEHEGRWRALRAWFDACPPDDQEWLLAHLERLIASTEGQDMGTFMDVVDQVFLLIDRLEAEPGQERIQGDTPPT